MKKLKLLFLTVICLTLFSCNQHMTLAYYYDNAKINDGEIFGEHLSSFFLPDEYIYIRKIHSNSLQKELKKISDTLNMTPKNQELDDGYYGYAFITSEKDTVFADYGLNYWKSNKKRKTISTERIKRIMRTIFENPYLKK